MMKSEHIDRLRQLVAGKDNVLTSKESLTTYSYDATQLWTHMPEVVVLPASTEEIAAVLKFANENKIPLTARGGGTNVSGGSIPLKGGIVMSLTRMNHILEINKTNLHATVEAGVVLQDLNLALAKEGLFFPPDPQSYFGCTMGGVVAENSGGPSCLKYGVTKQYVLGLEVALADGRIVKLGGLTPKNRTGYELMMLFVGSEGTLGVVTKATFKLLPLPKASRTIATVFDDIAVGGDAVSAIIASGTLPAKIEFVDHWTFGKFEPLFPGGIPKGAELIILIQVDGLPDTVNTEAEQVAAICRKGGAKVVHLTKDLAEAQTFWKARSARFADIHSTSHTVLSEDVCVPRDRLAEFIKRAREKAKQHDVNIGFAGHVGDGNLHPEVLTDNRDEAHYKRALECVDDIIQIALSLGGVLSGEHGIGLEKQRFLKMAMDPVAIEMMKKIKDVLDPNHILNPGKIWEEVP
jgi:glycolate oxidase